MKARGEVVRKWECGACNEHHDHEYQAEECCAPDVTELWVCPVCDEGHDKKADAEACCLETDACITCPQCLRDHDLGSLSYEAVKIAGHCTTCQPSFTIDQQQAIQDLHYRQTGKREHLHD
jgi:hypothetical protein